MKITKTIEMDIKKKGKNIVVGDLPTLALLMGTSSVNGNLRLYGISKVGNNYVVSLDKLKERKDTLEMRKTKINDTLDILNQVVQ